MKRKSESFFCLLEKPVIQFSDVRKLPCGMCLENYPYDRINYAACGHPFYGTCWADYISATTTDGSGCLMLRYPDSICDAALKERIAARDGFSRRQT